MLAIRCCACFTSSGGNCNGKGDGNGAAGAGDSADANGDARGSGNLDAADTAPPTEYPPGQVCSFCKSEAIEGGDGNERWRVFLAWA